MFRTIFIVLCVLLLSACSAQRLVLSLHTTNLINPDAKHQGLTLYVKIFQLNSADLFNKQSTNVLWKSTLGKTILSQKTLLLKNNDNKLISIDLNKKTKFIAVLADFRNTTEKNKVLFAINPGAFSATHIVILIQNNQIKLEDVS